MYKEKFIMLGNESAVYEELHFVYFNVKNSKISELEIKQNNKNSVITFRKISPSFFIIKYQ